MKNLILIFLLAQLLILPLGLAIASQTAQSATEANYETTNQPTVEKTGFFKRIWNTAKENGLEIGISFVVGLFAKNGITKTIKMFSGKAAVILKETGETFIGGSNFFRTVEAAIKDDGTYKENSIADVIAAGKEVIAEANDVIISIKPKPV